MLQNHPETVSGSNGHRDQNSLSERCAIKLTRILAPILAPIGANLYMPHFPQKPLISYLCRPGGIAFENSP